jgi:hypothetical protein
MFLFFFILCVVTALEVGSAISLLVVFLKFALYAFEVFSRPLMNNKLYTFLNNTIKP